jgi:hypothetical protein
MARGFQLVEQAIAVLPSVARAVARREPARKTRKRPNSASARNEFKPFWP